MGVEYEIRTKVTVTCDRCGRSAHEAETVEVGREGMTINSTRLAAALQKAARSIGAGSALFGSDARWLCAECLALVKQVISPVSPA